ncbi:ABC transporter permease [Phreatobacter sp. AB_2022a]|uniref:ABC transporter permease n=1 Tax=Phreatobacter sp. AB_2022a TaxID=3003134 RepID=UPI000579B05E|nr:ABC transporter permease [Phreatobacter sp. AB_2022a]MCZ0733369.1 ABC transporter permease [Phreatobacter sp. AB_2022a]CEJ10410.1 Dipeptide transport system permease protein DppB [bacterium YEK0313]
MDGLRLIARRLMHMLVTLFLVLTMMWALFRLVPGDPLVVFLGQGQLGPEQLEQLRRAWGLDRPLWQQYLSYIANFLTGDLGLSFAFRRPVLEVLAEPLLNTVILMAPAMALSISLAVKGGSWLGWRRGTRAESWISLALLVPRTLPVFWLAIIVVVIFSYQLEWFPMGGMRTMAFIPETWWEELPGFDLAQHLALPLMVAVLNSVSDPLLVMRTSMIEVANEDYLTYARAKGLTERQVQAVAQRNALMPIITYSAIMIGFAFGGQVLLEYVFSWPGMGQLMVNAVNNRDYPVAQAAFFLMAFVVIFMNFLTDLIYIVVDPRVRYE